MKIIDRWSVGYKDCRMLVVLREDANATPFDSAVYNEDHIRAWHDGTWCFVHVTVTPMLSSGFVFEWGAQRSGPIPWGEMGNGLRYRREWFNTARLPELADRAREAMQEGLSEMADELRRMGWTVVAPSGEGES